MRPAFLAALLLPLLAAPAAAGSFSTGMIGAIFCYARMADDMAPVLAILTPELSALVAAQPADSIRWQGGTEYAPLCRPVGAAGSAEAPESILSYQFHDPGKAGYSDRLVLRFIDGRLRIDDIHFSDQTTLRANLASN